MNNCSFLGNLTADPEIRYFESGKTKTTFTLAINEGKTKSGEEIVNFLDFECWDKQAEPIGQFFKKGSKIAVVSSAKKENYEDKDGNKRSKVTFRVNSFYFCGKKVD